MPTKGGSERIIFERNDLKLQTSVYYFFFLFFFIFEDLPVSEDHCFCCLEV